MAHQLTTWLGNATASSPSTFAAGYVPLLAATTSCVTLMLVTVLALVSSLAKSKTRRDAAYKVLKLLLDALRRARQAEPPHAENHPARTN